MSLFFRVATVSAVLVIGGATIALAQTVPAPQATTPQEKSQANDPRSGGVATPDKGGAGPASSQGTSQASKDKSKMDDPRAGAVPDKGGAATGPATGSGGVSKSTKNKSDGDDPQSGGMKKN
jgi:hypothetical protein